MTGFLYDAGRLIAEYNASGKVFAQYIHGSGLGHDVGSLICKETSESTAYYFYNYRGDVIDTLIGATVTSYRYDAFGNLIDSSAPEIGFSSKRYDSSTALSYFGARYYDAITGRFISRDPLGYIDGPNGYIYVSNNPLIWFDPFGLCRESAKKTSFSFAEAMATDPIRFSQTGYIPLSTEQISTNYTIDIKTSLDSGHSNVDILYFEASAHINIATFNLYTEVDTGFLRTETPIFKTPDSQLTNITRVKSLQLGGGLYNGIPGVEAYYSFVRNDIILKQSLGKTDLNIEADMYATVGSIGLERRFNPLKGGFSQGQAIGYGAGYKILIKQKEVAQ